MKFIKLPVIYTRFKTDESSAKDQSYRAVREEIGASPEEDDIEEHEVHDFMYVQDTGLVNVTVSPKISEYDTIEPDLCVLEYGSNDFGKRVFMIVRMSVKEMLKTLENV